MHVIVAPIPCAMHVVVYNNIAVYTPSHTPHIYIYIYISIHVYIAPIYTIMQALYINVILHNIMYIMVRSAFFSVHVQLYLFSHY